VEIYIVSVWILIYLEAVVLNFYRAAQGVPQHVREEDLPVPVWLDLPIGCPALALSASRYTNCSIMQYHAVSLNESCNIIQPSPWNLLGDGMFSLRSLISDSDGVQKAEAGAILQPSHQPQANLRESVVARFSYTFHIETV